jgi:glucokinase
MFAAIDIGGSNLRLGYFDNLDNPKPISIESIKTDSNYEQGLEDIKLLVGENTAESYGVAMPGLIEMGVVKGSPNLPDWVDKNLQSDLESLLDRPVRIANDAVSAALGEAHYGKPDYQSFLLITLGTGIGGSFVDKINGLPMVTSVEPGHMIVVPGGLPCKCGRSGCLEAYWQANDPQVTDYLNRVIKKLIGQHTVQELVFSGGAHMKLPKLSLPHRYAVHGELTGLYGALSLLRSIR